MIIDEAEKNKRAFRSALRFAESGDAKQQFAVGLMYANGVGVQQDFQQAMHWYHKAAENGIAAAQYILGNKYAEGNGVPKDINKALIWYLKACEQGHPKALYQLGRIYSESHNDLAKQCFKLAAQKGSPEAQTFIASQLANPAEALSLYRNAAEQDVAEAQFALGEAFCQGQFGAPDYQQAIFWYRKAARQDHIGAQIALEHLDKKGETRRKFHKVTHERRHSPERWINAAQKGDNEAKFRLAQMYDYGLGLPADVQEACKWYKITAEKGDTRAQLRLAEICEKSAPEQAVHWYSHAAKQGDVRAQFALGRLYSDGQGISPNLSLGLSHYLQAAEQNDPQAQLMLGHLFDSGLQHLAADWYQKAAQQGNAQAQFLFAQKLAQRNKLADAFHWCNLAAQQDHVEAQYQLAEMYRHGLGCEANPQQAVVWYRKAAGKNYVAAQVALEDLDKKGVTRRKPLQINDERRQSPARWIKAARKGDTQDKYHLAWMYEHGSGIEQDLSQAEYWYHKAAGEGDVRAQLRYAQLCEKDKPTEAIRWYLKAATQGSDEAQFALGRLYSSGIGIESNPQLGFSWYLNAGENGNPQAQLTLGYLCDAGLEHIAEKWYLQAAKQGVLEAQYLLANKYIDQKQYPDALNWLEKAANKEHSESLLALGKMYEQGLGMPADPQTAFNYYQKAAKQNFAAAQYQVALSYFNGQGTRKNAKKGLSWLEQAVAQKHPAAQVELAKLYETGGLVSFDQEHAETLYNEAAEQNFAPALVQLARLYDKTERSMLANELYQKAAAQGNPEAWLELGHRYRHGEFMPLAPSQALQCYFKAGKLPQAQLAIAQMSEAGLTTVANNYYQYAAEQGLPEAQHILAKKHLRGEGVVHDPKQAFEYLQLAAEQGFSPAQADLAECYQHGLGTTQDIEQAFAWYHKAAEQDNPKAQWNLGAMYASGQNNVPKDIKRAATWCRKAAIADFIPAQSTLANLYASSAHEESQRQAIALWQHAAQQGDAEAQYNLGLSYALGHIVEESPALAFNWLLQAAEQDVALAQVRVGLMYATGEHVPEDLIEAYKWFTLAAQLGETTAIMNREHASTLMSNAQINEAQRRAQKWRAT